jgi:hypothetical protein
LKRLLILSALALLLGGCGAATNVNARNDTGNTCVADVQDEPFVIVGTGLITGRITAEMNREIAERNTARRQAARAQQPPDCPPDVPRADQPTSAAFRQSASPAAIPELPPLPAMQPLPPPSNSMSVTFGPNGQAHPCTALGPSMTVCN